MRVLITSDLHVEKTGLEPIRRLVSGMDREHPDLVVIAGDIGNPAHLFDLALGCFRHLSCPVALVPGNHDLWCFREERSEDLYRKILPELTRAHGFHWLEDDALRLPGGFAVAGSIGWYDYSASDPTLNFTRDQILANKPRYAGDARMMDWALGDEEFAAECRSRLRAQLEALEADGTTHTVLVATHVPIFESQLEKRPENYDWQAGNAYFGHLTMGDEVCRFSKVRYVVSGHTHVGMNAVIERENAVAIGAAVIPSDYGRPRWVTLETDS